MKYRSKPFDVEAARVEAHHLCIDDVPLYEKHPFIGHGVHVGVTRAYLLVEGKWSPQCAGWGEWIIKDGDTFSVMSDEEFRRKYGACE